MAFNLDHTASGDITLVGSHFGFTGTFDVPSVQRNVDEVIILVENSPISAISGLQDELDKKTLCCNMRSVSSFDTGNGACQIPLIGASNLLSETIFPKATQTTMFVATNTGNLVNLTQAAKGDMATTTSPTACTFVLCSDSYNNINHWIPLQHPGNCILSVNALTGDVILNSDNIFPSTGIINFSTGNYVGKAVESLYTNKIVLSGLENDYMEIYGVGNFEDKISNYSTEINANNEISLILQTGSLQSCLNDYATTSCLNDVLLTGYIPKIGETGAAASLDTGIVSGNVVVVEQDGYISESLLPSLSITTTYSIDSYAQLTGLTNALNGDIAVDSTNLKNYILVGTGLNAYSQTGNWKELVGNIGSVYYINGQASDAYANVHFDASHVPDGTGTGYHVSTAIKDLVTKFNAIDSDNETCANFTGIVCAEYTLVSEFNTILATKSTTGHQHVISDVEYLGGCLDSIYAFKKGDLINLDPSDSYKLHPDSANTQSGALMLGVESKSTVFGEISIGAGKFIEIGDAQASEIVFKASTNVDSWQSLSNQGSSDISIESNSAVLVHADVVGKGVSNTGLFASFRLEGVVAKENSNASLAVDINKTVIARSFSGYDAKISTSTNSFNVQVLGEDGSDMHWVSKINLVKVKGEPASGNGPGVYFYAGTGNSWYDLNNWFMNAGHSIQASALPTSSSDVEMLSAAYVSLDLGFVTPASIDTTAVADQAGICFYSNSGNAFSGTIYGNASFFGNATLI